MKLTEIWLLEAPLSKKESNWEKW